MKVIDLLNKIANGEIDYTTKFDAKVNIGYCDLDEYFERYPMNENYLNCEIELEDTPKEDKKIKRIQSNGESLYSEYIGEWLIHKERYTEYDELLMNKINEIIDRLNGE